MAWGNLHIVNTLRGHCFVLQFKEDIELHSIDKREKVKFALIIIVSIYVLPSKEIFVSSRKWDQQVFFFKMLLNKVFFSHPMIISQKSIPKNHLRNPHHHHRRHRSYQFHRPHRSYQFQCQCHPSSSKPNGRRILLYTHHFVDLGNMHDNEWDNIVRVDLLNLISIIFRRIFSYFKPKTQNMS